MGFGMWSQRGGLTLLDASVGGRESVVVDVVVAVVAGTMSGIL